MGFDTMGSYRRLMSATYANDDEDDDLSDDAQHRLRSRAARCVSTVKCRDFNRCEDSKPESANSTDPALATLFRKAAFISEPQHPPLSTELSTSLDESFSQSSAAEKNVLATKLYVAAYAGDMGTMQHLLGVGVPIDCSAPVPALFESFKPPKRGHLSPLAGAASNNQLKAVKYLLANGAAINPSHSQSANSPLHQACRNNDMQMARYLLDHGADVNLPNSYNTTPLMYAVKYSQSKLTRLVLSYKPDLNKLSFIGAAALHWSIGPCYEESTEVLLCAGSNPDMVMLNGDSALHCAVQSGLIHKVQSLLYYGANPHVRNAENRTPYETAQLAGAEDIAQLLRKAMFQQRLDFQALGSEDEA